MDDEPTTEHDPEGSDIGPEPATLNDMLATGASYRQIDHWVRQGYLTPDAALPGSGAQRRWAPRDVAIAYLMVRLTRAGVTASTAAMLATRTVDDHEAVIELDGFTITVHPIPEPDAEAEQ